VGGRDEGIEGNTWEENGRYNMRSERSNKVLAGARDALKRPV
jgi:hypothetical protein